MGCSGFQKKKTRGIQRLFAIRRLEPQPHSFQPGFNTKTIFADCCKLMNDITRFVKLLIGYRSHNKSQPTFAAKIERKHAVEMFFESFCKYFLKVFVGSYLFFFNYREGELFHIVNKFYSSTNSTLNWLRNEDRQTAYLFDTLVKIQFKSVTD